MSDTVKNKDFSYFYKLEFEGVNCFKDKQVLDLSDGNENYAQWTIILGDNGTGKTTLLRILDRLQPFEDEFEHGGNKIKMPIFTYDRYNIQKDLVSYNFEFTLRFICGKEIITQNCSEKKDTYGILRSEYSNIFLLSYGASRRMSKNQNISSKSNDGRKVTSLFDESIELINAEEWLLQKELTAVKAEHSSRKKFSKQLKLVKQILTDILPDVEDIRVKPINENNSKLLIEVKTPYGWVNLRDLSFGYQTLTALIVDIAAKMMEQYQDSENPLAEPVIILIDEIDLHLHPKWQRTVLDKLSQHFPAAQFIATSHSPLIVQAAQDKGANIVVCRKEDDRVNIDNDPDEVKGWRVDQILVSDLFNTEGSRSNELENYIKEKNNILSKRELSEHDKQKLKFINNKLDEIPFSTDKKNIDAEEIIRKAAQLLKK